MLMPPNVQRMLAKDPPRRSLPGDIKHVVILMQENRSFDHYFGTLSGVRGFADSDALKLSGGRSVFYQPDAENPEGYMLPFHLNTARQQCSENSFHKPRLGSTTRGLERRTNGPMAACPSQSGRRQCALLHGLLQTGRHSVPVCVGGDLYSLRCVSLLGYGPHLSKPHVSDDRHDRPGWNGRRTIIKNVAPEGGYTWTTYPERLEQAGISWKVYQQQDNYGCNMLQNFRVFRQAAKGSSLHSKGVLHGPEGQFEYDAMHDKLPAVSWIVPTSFQSEHPDYMPADGAAFVASKLDAIAANPDVWAKTAFILNYDENDGIFDHVPPPVAPPGTPHEFVGGLPIGAGFRVPCIIVSPWTAGGWVCSEPFDHTSVLQFLENFTGVREPNITDWRRKTFGDLASVFRFDHAEKKPPLLPETSGQLSLAKYGSIHLPEPALPGSDQQPPMQEKGHRHRIAKNES